MSASGVQTTDWFASNAPRVTAEPSKLPGAPPTHVQATPAAADMDWFAKNAPPIAASTTSLPDQLRLMSAALSGQTAQLSPEEIAQGEAGKKAGFESAGATALTTLGGELLLAPRAVGVLSKVPAGRDPVTGQMLPWVVKETATEGPSLARAGAQALKAAGDAHPLVRQVIINGLTALGAGGIAKALGWIGKAVD